MPMGATSAYRTNHAAQPYRYAGPAHPPVKPERTIKSVLVGWLLIVFSLVVSVDAKSETWVNTGPLGGRVYCAVVHPTSSETIYAALQEGFYRSTDAGESWERLPTPWSPIEVVFDPLFPNVVYARTFSRLYRSTDAGETWEEVGAFPIMSFAIDPNYPERLFVGTDNGSGMGNGFVFKSTDRGDSWVKRDTGSWCSISALAVSLGDSNTIYAGTSPYEPEQGGDGVYRTTDGGLTWQRVGLSYGTIGDLAVDPSDPLVVYSVGGGCGSGGDLVCKSTDGGDTWEPAGTGLSSGGFVESITVDPAQPGVVYAGTYHGLFKTTTGGSAWFPVDTGIDEGDIRSVSIFPLDNDILFLGGTGVFRSEAGGHGLELLGVVPVGVSSVAVDREDSQTIFAIGKWAYKTTDYGAHWQPINNGMGEGLVIVQDPADAQVLYGGSYHYYYGGVYKTTDAGATWQASLRDVAINDIEVAPTDPGIVFAGGGDLFRSENAGNTWTTVDQTQTSCIAIDPTDAATVYAGGHTGLRKSVDGGDTWFPIENGLNLPASGYVLALAIDSFQPQVLYCGTTRAGVFKSVNGGTSWINSAAGMTTLDTRDIAIDPSNTDILYAATWWGGGVFMSYNGAVSWESVGAGSLHTGIIGLAIDPHQPNVVYAAGGGLWRYTAPPLVPAVSCPGDTAILAYSQLPSLLLRDFAITNPSAEDSSAFRYQVTSEGPCTLTDNGDPSSLAGTTPLLGPGDSYAPPKARLLVPPIRVVSAQRVRFAVSAIRPGGGADTCVTTIEFQPPVPVFIRSFVATATRDGVELAWALFSDEEVRGFRVYRRPVEESTPVLMTPRLIPSDVTHFTDREARAGRTYEYQLGVVLSDQSEVMSRPSQTTVPTLSLVLFQNMPNPFETETTIALTLPFPSNARLVIYDVRGHLVRRIAEGVFDEGYREFVWDGTDQQGHAVSSGVFFYRLTSGNRTLTKKMMLLR